jgi:hypothetical protein
MSELRIEFSSVVDELRKAYLSTYFYVLEPAQFTLKIGELSQNLASLYRD